MAFYRSIRAGVPTDALQIGQGYNRAPPSAAVLEHLRNVTEDLFTRGRLAEYSCPDDDRERALLANLVNQLLGTSFEGDDVVFTHGATEGISVAIAWAAHARFASVLPLPCYYSFEQSSRRWGLLTAAYYDPTGALHHVHGSDNRHMLEVVVVPNGVTGSLYADPAVDRARVAFTLVDTVFLSDPATVAPAQEAVASALAERAPERAALLITASKDLSLPGLRAGALLSRSRELVAFARTDRFERSFALSPLASRAVLAYLAVLLGERGVAHHAIASTFSRHGLPRACPPSPMLTATRKDFRAMAEHVAKNMALATASGAGLCVEPGWRPQFGYSALMSVDRPFADADAFAEWVHRTGVDGRLKLNPSELFGGTRAAWHAMYPGRHCIRINASPPRDEFRRTLERLVQLRET